MAKAKGAPKKTDPAALAMLLQMLMAQHAQQGQGPPGLPAWRAGRPPSISPAGSPPLL